MRRSTAVYSPHWIIENNGEVAANVYDDAFNSPQEAEMFAKFLINRTKPTNYQRLLDSNRELFDILDKVLE